MKGLVAVMVLLFPAVVFGQITEYPLPAGSHPRGIAAGTDGALWFTETYSADVNHPALFKIGKITTSGAVTEFCCLTGTGGPGDIVSGPDGNLWFVEEGSVNGFNIGRMTTGGVLTEFPIAGIPYGIAAGPDGNLWITVSTPSAIVKMSTTGVVLNTYPLVALSNPVGITVGPDGNLWFTEDAGRIGRITTAGVLTEFGPTPGCPARITTGPDGALWFTSACANKVGRITTAGVVTEFNVGAYPYYIAPGSDGALWFTENGLVGRIGRITTAGVFTEFAIPFALGNPHGIAGGPDGRVWFTEVSGSRIGAIQLAGVSIPAMSTWMLMLLALVMAAVGVRAAKGS